MLQVSSVDAVVSDLVKSFSSVFDINVETAKNGKEFKEHFICF